MALSFIYFHCTIIPLLSLSFLYSMMYFPAITVLGSTNRWQKSTLDCAQPEVIQKFKFRQKLGTRNLNISMLLKTAKMAKTVKTLFKGENDNFSFLVQAQKWLFVMLSHVTFHMSHITCDVSNAYVDPRDMLNNFCFDVYQSMLKSHCL